MTNEAERQPCFQIRVGAQSLVLASGQTIAASSIPGLQPLRHDGVVAAVAPSPELQGALAITNLSTEDWRMTLPGDERLKLPPGLRTRLVAGTTVDFGGVSGVIVFEAADPARLSGGQRAVKPFVFAGQAYWTKPELAVALAGNWSQALLVVDPPHALADWLRTGAGDAQASEHLLDLFRLDAYKSLTAADRLSLFLPRLDPSLPPFVAGGLLTADYVASLARAAGAEIANLPAVLRLDGGLGQHFASLTSAGWLMDIHGGWVQGVLDAEAFDRELRRDGPPRTLLFPARAPSLLLLVADPAAREAARQKIADGMKTLASRRSKWANALPPPDGLTTGGVWAAQQRLAEMLRDGRRFWRPSRVLALIVFCILGAAFYLALRPGRDIQTSAELEADPRWRQCNAVNSPALETGCSALIASRGTSPLVKASAYDRRGDIYYGAGMYHPALTDYTAALPLRQDDVHFRKRGDTYYMLGDINSAFQDYSAAINLNRFYAPAYVGRADAETDLRRYDNAVADANVAISLRPTDAAAWTARGRANFGKAQYHFAVFDFGRALELNQLYASAYVGRADAETELQRYDDAIADANHAIALQPNNSYAWNACGRGYFNKAQYNFAEFDFGRALTLEPRNSIYSQNLEKARAQTTNTQSSGWMGVSLQDMPPDRVAQWHLSEPFGAVVVKVENCSPAAAAGIVADDIILKFDGQNVANMRMLPVLIGQTSVGKSVTVHLWRAGREMDVAAVIGRRAPN
jgi:tetratricopeptide (TPR) repeat protein